MPTEVLYARIDKDLKDELQRLHEQTGWPMARVVSALLAFGLSKTDFHEMIEEAVRNRL